MFAGLKPYVCSVCDYAGRSRSNLKTHMNRHNTERRHLCDLCGKKFKSKVTLKSHRLTHTDEGLLILLVINYYPLSIHNVTQCVIYVTSILYTNFREREVTVKMSLYTFQVNPFSVQSVTSPQSPNLPYSGTWSNTLNLR